MIDLKERLQAIRGLNPDPATFGTNVDIRSLKQGGYLDIDGESHMVTSVYKYLEVKWSNFKKPKKKYWVTELQLLNLLSGEKTFVEWEVDDELEIGQTLNQVKLKDISCNNRPLTRQDLEDIAEEEHGSVICDGTTFHYSEDDTWAALFYREESDQPLQVRMYEFYADNETYLTIELWEDEDSKPEREAFISRELKAKSIAVLQPEPCGVETSEVSDAAR